MKAFIGCIAAGLAAGVAFVASAQATTAPSNHVTALVEIFDTKIRLTKYLGDSSAPGADLTVMPGPIPRGDVVAFRVVNMGKKATNFVIAGHKTSLIKPGKIARFTLTLNRRGKFQYGTTFRGSAFHGVLIVY